MAWQEKFQLLSSSYLRNGQLGSAQLDKLPACLGSPNSSSDSSLLVEVEVHTVPHFKGSVNGKVEPRKPEDGGIFI